MINSRRKNRAAIVNKQSSQCNYFFGGHIGKPNDSLSNWLQTFNSRNQRMLDPIFILRSMVGLQAASKIVNSNHEPMNTFL